MLSLSLQVWCQLTAKLTPNLSPFPAIFHYFRLQTIQCFAKCICLSVLLTHNLQYIGYYFKVLLSCPVEVEKNNEFIITRLPSPSPSLDNLPPHHLCKTESNNKAPQLDISSVGRISPYHKATISKSSFTNSFSSDNSPT